MFVLTSILSLRGLFSHKIYKIKSKCNMKAISTVPAFCELRNEIRCPFRNPLQQKVTRVTITNTELCFHKALKIKVDSL